MKFARMSALMIALALCAGCGGTGANPPASDSPSTQSAADAPADTSSAPSSDGSQVKLLYTYWGSAFEKDAQASAVTEFMAQNPGIEVEPLHIPASGQEYVAKLTAMTAAGQNPDVGYMDVPTAFVWAKEGKFYDIFELIDKDPDWDKDKYVDDIFYMYEPGKSFGTTSSINPRLIFYNVDCFTEAGVEVPPTDSAAAWTWDEMIETAKKLTFDMEGRDANDPSFDSSRIRQYGIYINPDDMTILSILLDSNGGDLLTEDGAKLALDTPEAKEVIQALHDMIHVHHVSPIPNDFSSMPNGAEYLNNKQAAMFISGQWFLLDIAKLGFNYDLGQLPKFKEARNIKDAGTRVIFSNTAHPDEAWALYKFLANPEGAMSLYHDGLWMPTLKEWYEDESKFAQWGKDNPAHPESYKPVVADSLFNGTATPSWGLRIANINELQLVFRPLLQQVWLDSKGVDEVVEEINAQVGDRVQGYNPDNFHASHYR